MAKKNKKEIKETSDKKSNRDGVLGQIGNETKQAIFAIVFFAMTILSILAYFHKSGIVGNKTYDILEKLLGVGYLLIPLLFLLLGISFIKAKQRNLGWLKIAGIIIFFVSGLGVIGIIWNQKGGVIGNVISSPLMKLFDFYTSLLILIALITISSLIIFETKLDTNSFLAIARIFGKKKEGEDAEV